MSNVCRAESKVFGLWKHSTKDKSFINELENTYYRLLISNYGPNNGLTLIRNSASNDFVTSSSKTLLQQLSFFHPCFKFINALMNAQLKRYGVHGLYVGTLCSGLLFRALKLEDFVCHQVVKHLSEWIQCSFMEKLRKEIHRIALKVDVGQLDQILSVVKGVIYSKSYYDLSKEEKEHISLKIVEAFLKSFPDDKSRDFGKVLILPVEGPSSLDSFTVNGILHRPVDCSRTDFTLKLKTISKETLKVIVFTVPLSPDMEEKNLIEWHSDLSFELSFNDRLRELLRNVLKRKDVNIIANQMFIHAALKFDLEKDGFLVLERLGTAMTNSLVDMIGCCPVANLSEIQSISDDHVRRLSAIDVISVGEKIYLNILPVTPHQSTTLVLTGINSHVIEYLKESIETSISLLQMLMKDTSAAIGAGCFESVAAHILYQMKKDSVVHLAKMFGTSIVEVNMVFDEYIETFMQLSIVPSGGKSKKIVDYFVDSTFHHLWKFCNGWETEERCYGARSVKTEPKLLYSSVHARCVCGSISQSELPFTSDFTSLLSIKKRREFDVCKFREGPDSIDQSLHHLMLNPSSSLEFHETSILDYLPAKLNALQFAFDGFSELYRVGTCIFDK